MSKPEEILDSTDEEEFVAQFFPSDVLALSKESNKKKRVVLKSRENIYKQNSKYTRLIKNKLKKYKLRKNGEEDVDIINVSQYLSSSLTFHTQCNFNNNNEYNENIDEWTINYLTKMAKKSEKSLKRNKVKTMDESVKCKNENKITISPLNISEEIDTSCAISPKFEDSSNSPQKNTPFQTNAFMLMMGARNKSIGSNSPGKAIPEPSHEDEKVKKSLKIKRNTALEKMALAKGSQASREIEEIRDEVINMKMAKRAKTLKKLLHGTPKLSNSKSPVIIDDNDTLNIPVIKRPRPSKSTPGNAKKRLKTDVSDDDDDDVVFVDNSSVDTQVNDKIKHVKSITEHISPSQNHNLLKKKITKADSEFLSKLSPSIKKKENMFSYFNKIEKENKDEECEESPFKNVIKVKFTPKRNKLLKRKVTPNVKEDTNMQIKINEANNIEIEDKSIPKKIISASNASQVNEFNYVNETTKLKKIQNKEICKISTNIEQNEIKQQNKNKDSSDIKTNNKNKTIVSSKLVECDKLYSHSKEVVENERRSKRISRKPIKYKDSFESSSDEDLIIFEKLKSTKKHPANSLKLKKAVQIKSKLSSAEIDTESCNDGIKQTKNEIGMSKKLAPIFAQKVQLSKADLEAKQKFLHSGIPDKLKKIIEKQQILQMESESFSIVHHIQQKCSSVNNFDAWNLGVVNLELKEEECDATLSLPTNNSILKLEYQDFTKKENRCQSPINCKEQLQIMKNNYPKFPVYRIFKQLKTKCITGNQLTSVSFDYEQSFDVIDCLLNATVEDPKTSLWCDKFRPESTNDIIGNFDSVNTLKKWLSDWKESNFDSKRHRLRSDSNSSESDFYYPSDSDSRDSQKLFNNVLVVAGPPGCGKTSSIYAVAAELSIKVIEVNTSAKRSGKVILSNLQEATQSHKVNRKTTSAENSQNSQDTMPKNIKQNQYSKSYSKKSKSDKKNEGYCIEAIASNSQNQTENNQTGMSLILIEDADLVFDQDDGFISALNLIVQTSKRPVILVTSSLNCPHLQRFITRGNIVKFNPLSPKMLGMWLDLMCVVEKGYIWPNTGQNLLEFYAGDIRKAINALQFWIGSTPREIENVSEEPITKCDSQDVGSEDDCSSMSWTEQDIRSTKNTKDTRKEIIAKLNKYLFSSFISVHDHDVGITQSMLQFPVNHLNLWWNIPQIFSFDLAEKRHENNKCLKSLAKLAESISLSEVLASNMMPSLETSVVSCPWKNRLCDSVRDGVDMSSYSRAVALGDSISYALLTSSIAATQRAFGLPDEDLQIDYTLPGLSQIKSKERIWTRHNGLNGCLPLSNQLDRRAVATDYLSMFREICRIEKDKSDNNIKRNNRFCHYLKSMKVACGSETLDSLCDSFKSG